MTNVMFDALTSRLGRPTRNRVALAVSHAIADSRIRRQVVPFGSSKLAGRAAENYFERLLQEEGCRDAWDEYVDTTTGFPQLLASGAAPLNGFRHYTLQDAIYLEYYVRVRMGAIGTWDSKVSTDDLASFVATIQEGLSYSTNTRLVCENQLGMPPDAVEDEWNNGKSNELKTSIKYYEDVIGKAIETDGGDSWLDIHFALLPCIKGYYEIAKALLQSTTTIRNTLYYTLWIEGNADGSYVKEYDAFIQDNIGTPTDEQWAHWGAIFKRACNNEKDFFNLAITKYLKYDIVTEGDWVISPYTNREMFLSVEGDEVVISENATSWQLVNSEDGYLIKLDDMQFLGYDGQNVVIQSDDPTKWSINSIFISEDLGTFQLFLAGAIQLALDAASDNDNTLQVTVKPNDLTTQLWIFAPGPFLD